jgi:hypothetical protein
MRKVCILAAVAACTSVLSSAASAAVSVTVDPAAPWQGFMNVFDLSNVPQFQSPWGTADLTAVFTGPVLKLGPNTIGDADPYWYIGGGAPGNPGNKIMDANMYVEDSTTLPGQTVNFTGTVLSNSFVSGYTTVAFIKDFSADFSSVNSVTVPLTPGAFSLSLATVGGAGHHVQYGFETIGRNVWITDAASVGFATVTASAVPEPTTLAAALTAGLVAVRRRRA